MRILVCVLLTCLIAPGCVTISGNLPVPAAPVPADHFKVGAARCDITPMPGYPMGGFAAAGRISRGVWTRLHARSFVFEDVDGHTLALVSCDLWAIPGGLADRVAELVATEYGVPRLGREQIVLAATHTHHSPGNFATSTLYNALASVKPFFDEDLFDFLAHRIAKTIAEAFRNRAPAILVRNEKPLGQLARNRSLGAFLANGTAATDLIQQNAALTILETTFKVGGPDAHRAVDPTLTVIRAMPAGASPDQMPIAVLAFFAAHPTSMGPDTEVYSADLFGVAATLIERGLTGTVAGFFNGAEGDVSSNWEQQNRPSALMLGGLLAEGVLDLLASPGRQVEGEIRYEYGHCSLAAVARPFAGASMLSGSEGDWAFLRDAGWHEGLIETDPARRTPGHGSKKNPLHPDLVELWFPVNVSDLLDYVGEIPKTVPLQVFRIGATHFATLPGEFTTLLGKRISASVAGAIAAAHPGDPPPDRVILLGLANEYLSYFTTGDEHEQQHYEGGSMLYGPASADAIEGVLGDLAGRLGQTPPRTIELAYKYKPGLPEQFGVGEFDLLDDTERLRATYNSLSTVLMDEHLGIPVPDHPYLVWVDADPEWPDDPRVPYNPTPRVKIEVNDSSGWSTLLVDGEPEDDRGLDFVTTVVASFDGKSRWISIWMAPPEVDPQAKLRFVVEGTGGRTFTSNEFTVESARQDWGFVGLLR